MPATRVVKPKPVEASRAGRGGAVSSVRGTGAELRPPAARKTRASSCPRCPQRGRGERPAPAPPAGAGCERRSRSTNPDHRTRRAAGAGSGSGSGSGSSKQAGVSPKCREQRGVRPEAKSASHSHKAFTVIPPNPKKRREIQRKAEAELAALEELRLSRAMAYVSINPSSVGGCMSLEEVRLKQQQEMMQARRKQKPL